MSNKTFTQKEIEVLRTSPYVQNVSQSMVFFPASFKEQFWKMLCDGKAPRDIVIALGIDPNILGDNRIAGLKSIVKREVKAGKGFRDYIIGWIVLGFGCFPSFILTTSSNSDLLASYPCASR